MGQWDDGTMGQRPCAQITLDPEPGPRFTATPQCDSVATMNGRRTEGSTHAVLAIDADKRVLEEQAAVPNADVSQLIRTLQARFGADVRILVDGVAIDTRLRARSPAAPEAAKEPVHILEDREDGRGKDPVADVELAHAMLWNTYDRAARVQSWMLEQASTFTLELLHNNKRLADQAGELQKRYQTALAEIDYMAREQKLMEGEAAAARLSRHLIEKARAEIVAANPTKSADWIDDLIDGAAVALGAMCGTRGPRDPKNSN